MVAQTPSSPPTPITPPSEPPHSNPAEPTELHDASTGRTWPRAAIDRLIVGRLHGPYDWTQTCLHLGLTYPDSFADVTESELQRFWHEDIPRTTLLNWWSSREADDVEVRKVLGDIREVVEEGQEFYERTLEDEGRGMEG